MRILILIMVIMASNLICPLQALYNYFPMSDYIPNELDALSMAMGKTSILNSHSANSLYNNPAKLGATEKSNFTMSSDLGSFSDKKTYQPDNNHNSKMNGDYKFKISNFTLNQPLFLGSQKNILGIGVGYRYLYSTPSKTDYQYEVYDKILNNNAGNLKIVTLGTGTRVYKSIYLGVNGNFVISDENSYKSKSDYAHSNQYEDNVYEKVSGNFWKTSLYLKTKNDYEFTLSFTPSYQLKYDITNFTVFYNWSHVDENEYKYIIEYPTAVTLAMNLLPGKFKAGIEYSRLMFSDYRYIHDTMDVRLYSSKVKDGNALRLGFAYASKVNLRTGLFIESIPLNSNKLTRGFTLGIGTKLIKYASIDLAFLHEKAETAYSYVKTSDSGFGKSVFPKAVNVEEKFTRTKYMLSLNYEFSVFGH